jgi:hypothetical protein
MGVLRRGASLGRGIARDWLCRAALGCKRGIEIIGWSRPRDEEC